MQISQSHILSDARFFFFISDFIGCVCSLPIFSRTGVYRSVCLHFHLLSSVDAKANHPRQTNRRNPFQIFPSKDQSMRIPRTQSQIAGAAVSLFVCVCVCIDPHPCYYIDSSQTEMPPGYTQRQKIIGKIIIIISSRKGKKRRKYKQSNQDSAELKSKRSFCAICRCCSRYRYKNTCVVVPLFFLASSIDIRQRFDIVNELTN